MGYSFLLKQFRKVRTPIVSTLINPGKRFSYHLLPAVLSLGNNFDGRTNFKERSVNSGLEAGIVHTFEEAAIFFFALPQIFLFLLSDGNVSRCYEALLSLAGSNSRKVKIYW